jgi:uncharacterized protein (DUF488 family)
MLATIGYEKSTLQDFIATLQHFEIEVLVDIRDRAQARRPGFSKSALSSAMEDAGIEYVHLKALGDPKEGREAARSGEFEKFIDIFSNVLNGDPAKEAIVIVERLARIKRICLMCYERDHIHCHRKMVSDSLEKILGIRATHLGVNCGGSDSITERRMLYTRESATA